MSPDPIAASVDRVVDGVATLLLDDDTELHVDTDLLPDGTGEGDWITVDRTTDPPTIVADAARTTERRDRLSDRMARLRQRSRRFPRPDDPPQTPPDRPTEP